MVAVLTSALLEFSYCPRLCEQLLEAGLLPVLSTLLLPEAAAGMSSKLSTQVGAGSLSLLLGWDALGWNANCLAAAVLTC